MTPIELYRANISWLNNPELPKPEVEITSKDLAVLALLDDEPRLFNLLDFQIDKRTTRVKVHLKSMEERGLITVLPESNIYSHSILSSYGIQFSKYNAVAYSLGSVFGVDFQAIKDETLTKSTAYLEANGML